MRKSIIFLCLTSAIVFSCKKDSDAPPIDENIDLDGTKINDSSLLFPEKYLLSAAIPLPTPLDLNKPVVIAIHGFSATNYEWTEFRDWAKSKPNILTSLVLLGGHGRDYEDFKKSTWEDWQAPIITEYNKLVTLGYKKITILASSTGCPLVLNILRNNKINNNVLKSIFFIDPLVVPSNKQITLIKAIGPIIGYTEAKMEQGENGYWYKFTPQHALKELEAFSRMERKQLEKGVEIPDEIDVSIYKSTGDGIVDPISAVLLEKGLKHKNGSSVQVTMVNSKLHVFTRLHGRNSITPEDQTIQLNTFLEIYSSL